MKKVIFLVGMYYLALSCFGQTRQSSIDFMNFLNYHESVSKKDCSLNKGKNLSVSYIYYEFSPSYETKKKGQGCFFAIPQKEFKIWKVDNKTDWTREDLVNNNTEKLKMARKLLFTQRDTLFANFDLYVLYVKQNDLIQEGSNMSDDGQLIEDYRPKDNATVYTYKYENSMWIEIKKENINGEVPRTFGTKVVENILKERFGKDILDR
jgi:hypothetical protein